MTPCGDDCCHICDFCSYYDTPSAYCERHSRSEAPENTCEKFHCIRSPHVPEVRDSEA